MLNSFRANFIDLLRCKIELSTGYKLEGFYYSDADVISLRFYKDDKHLEITYNFERGVYTFDNQSYRDIYEILKKIS